MAQKLGLILEGGGVKGVYQLGALEALYEAGVHFDGVAGTSIGALNGAVLVGDGIERLAELWDRVTISDAFELDEEWLAKFRHKDFDLDMITYAGKKLASVHNVIKDSYNRGENFVYSNIDEGKIRSSKMDFGLVTYNITDMQPVEVMKEDIPEGKLVDYVVASASFPIFPAKEIDGKKYIDGGVYDNMPVNLLARHGYDKFVVIRTNVASKQPKRMIERDDLDVTYIMPKTDLGRPMAFNETKFGAMRKMGYNDAMRLLDSGKILPYNN
jgi:NTE family protein